MSRIAPAPIEEELGAPDAWPASGPVLTLDSAEPIGLASGAGEKASAPADDTKKIPTLVRLAKLAMVTDWSGECRQAPSYMEITLLTMAMAIAGCRTALEQLPLRSAVA